MLTGLPPEEAPVSIVFLFFLLTHAHATGELPVCGCIACDDLGMHHTHTDSKHGISSGNGNCMTSQVRFAFVH